MDRRPDVVRRFVHAYREGARRYAGAFLQRDEQGERALGDEAHRLAEALRAYVPATVPEILLGAPFIDRNVGIRAADIEPLGSVLEVVPTLLYLRGLDLARDMEGAVMETILDDELLSERPARFIDTYERPPEPGEPSEVDPELEEEMIERFRSLGYIGG